jgi:hypothetical protein
LRPLPGVETELPRPKGVCKLLEIHGRLVAEVRDWKRCDARRNGEGGTVAARKKRGKEAEKRMTDGSQRAHRDSRRFFV